MERQPVLHTIWNLDRASYGWPGGNACVLYEYGDQQHAFAWNGAWPIYYTSGITGVYQCRGLWRHPYRNRRN